MKLNTLSNWLEASTSAFDVLVGDAGQLPSETVFVDRAFLDQEFECAFPDRFGAFPLEAADPLLQKVALTYARRLASSEAARLGTSASGLKHAWFHPLYAEIMTLVPVRHLARKLFRQNTQSIFAIELTKNTFAAVNYWRFNELEPIYLAYELRRLGAKVCIRMNELDSPVFYFALSNAWRRKWHSQFLKDRSFSTILCKKHMRRDDFASQQSGATRRFRPNLATLLKSRSLARNPDQLTIKLQENPAIDGLQAYSAPDDTPTLLQAFAHLMSPATQFLIDWFRQELDHKDIQAVHIADHASLEGGLLAAECVRQGGKIHLWPHSANVVDVNVHEPDDVAKITLAARSTAAVWAKKFGKDKVSVDVQSVLPDTRTAPPFDDTRSIHVILFAGAHALQRVPFFGLEGHKASWKTVLTGLQSIGVQLTIKHKSQWETRDWINDHSDNGSRLSFTRTPANKLNLPNMVFMSISLTSTAIFEGIARGIPGIVVRDIPVSETPYYDPKFVPCISSGAVADYLTSLNNKKAWEALRDKQLDWFANETSW